MKHTGLENLHLAHTEDCENWWLHVWLSWFSGRELVAQVRGVLGLFPGD